MRMALAIYVHIDHKASNEGTIPGRFSESSVFTFLLSPVAIECDMKGQQMNLVLECHMKTSEVLVGQSSHDISLTGR